MNARGMLECFISTEEGMQLTRVYRMKEIFGDQTRARWRVIQTENSLGEDAEFSAFTSLGLNSPCEKERIGLAP
jgi:hypothetical protein